MSTIEQIKSPVSGNFARYEQYMRESLASGNEYVSGIIDYIVDNRGKGIRPMLAFLLAGIHGANRDDDRMYLAAMLVEMIHNASLVHDDVVDEADMRHGQPTVNSKWNSRVSILTGDYILARSFSAGMRSGHFDIVAYITECVSDLAEGELIQIDVNNRKAMNRQNYLDIIFKKTATLMGASCGSGAMAAGVSATEVEKARRIGLDLGMAFQIKDDILDYYPENQTGKPFCADLREKKVTLPLLTILERSDALTTKLIMGKIECIDKDPGEIQHIYEFVVKEGGISAAGEAMDSYLESARTAIMSYPDSPYRKSLLELCDFIGAR